MSSRSAAGFGNMPQHRRILLGVVLIELLIFTGYRLYWWNSIRSSDRPLTLSGEGLTIRSDGLGYYAWLRSLLVDGDWSFDNEFDEHNALADCVPPPHWRTELGYRKNIWSVGPACVWSLTIVPLHFGLQALNHLGLECPVDGYAWPYQLAVGVTSFGVSVLGLGLLYHICLRFARPERAALAAACLTLGTTIVHYSAAEVSMAHGIATATLAGVIWYWLGTYGSTRPGRWLMLGFLIGMAALMRWQLLTFGVLLGGEWCLMMRRSGSERSWRRWMTGLRVIGKKGDCPPEIRGESPFFPIALGLPALAAGGTALALLPQLMAWHYLYGHWFMSASHPAHHWLQPSLWQLLVAQDRSLFYWTPITLLALAGWVGYLGRRAGCPVGPATCPTSATVEPCVLLFVAFLLQVYVLASLWGQDVGQGSAVCLGAAFGFRQLTESLVVLAPGLALAFEAAPPRRYRALQMVSCLLVLWNLLLMCQYYYGLVPSDAGVGPATLARNLTRLLCSNHYFFLALMVAYTSFLKVTMR